MLSYRHGVLAACLCLHACGSGGAGSGSSGTGTAQYGRIHLLSTEPADGAVQVALDAQLRLRFDAAMVLDCMSDEDTWLRAQGSSTNVAGTFSLQEGGRAVVFTPAAPLQPETDYVFTVGPLTCDQSGRILETAASFTFRTFDDTAPVVVGANVLPNETGRSRTAPLVVNLTEGLAAASVSPTTVVLRDQFGQRYACTRTAGAATLTVTPQADLPGDRLFTLQLAGTVTDRAGNPLGQNWSLQFRTAVDAAAPSVVSMWPPGGATGISPLVEPIVVFDESMDPASVEPTSLLFQDDFGSIVAFAVTASADQRTLRVRPLQPLQPGRHYVMAFLVSAAAVTDVSGNGLQTTQPLSFYTSSDTTAPALTAADPADGQTRVSINVQPQLAFDGALDPNWVTGDTVQLLQGGAVVPAVLQRPDASTIRLLPVLPLLASGTYVLRVTGGHAGVRDAAGNVLARDLDVTFATAADATLPGAMLQPADGATQVATTVRASVVFDSVLDAATVSDATCELRADDGTPLPALVSLDNGDRVVTIRPLVPLQAGAYYRTFVRGGAAGVREQSGNWLATDLNARFRTGTGSDTTAPTVTATINAIDVLRRSGVMVPPAGFTIDVTSNDGTQVPDMGSVTVALTGPVGALAPTPAELFAGSTVGFRTWRATLPAALPLADGTWTATVTVADLSGNVGTAPPVTFTVTGPRAEDVPFERTQVVWARTDLDRDGNGRADFDDDMVRLGLLTVGDPLGTNAYVRRLLRDAILATANALYGRGPHGEPVDADSVAIRFTTHQPVGLGHLQIALGGFDPEGPRNRSYGDQSTGVLGRAFFDPHNSDQNDRDIGMSPGLGVFPAEMFLYQADIHRQVWPSFQTMWAQRFLPLCPAIGGTPAGSDPLDAVVLVAGFDIDHANSTQRARWRAVMDAIDDWAVVTGTVLAHEVGHAVGLVAPGPAPGGLYGDASLHNSNASAAEVMAPAVGYEAILSLTYAFRDLDIAYLRHRIVQR